MYIFIIAELDLLLEQPNQKVYSGTRDFVILQMLCKVGIGITELLSVKREQVNLIGNYIIIVKEEKREEKIITFSQEIKVILEHYFASQGEQIISDYLFHSTNGKPLTRQGLWKMVKKYARKTNIAIEITPQILKNTFANSNKAWLE